jgi:hypothetical protein
MRTPAPPRSTSALFLALNGLFGDEERAAADGDAHEPPPAVEYALGCARYTQHVVIFAHFKELAVEAEAAGGVDEQDVQHHLRLELAGKLLRQGGQRDGEVVAAECGDTPGNVCGHLFHAFLDFVADAVFRQKLFRPCEFQTVNEFNLQPKLPAESPAIQLGHLARVIQMGDVGFLL